MFFSNINWAQLKATFYSIRFETSICRFNSSTFSPIMSDEVREHLTMDWNGQSRSLALCSVTHFCVVFEFCVWIIVWLEDPNTAHYKISHSHFFHLLVFDRIHDAMCLNKMSRTSSRNIGPQHQKYSSLFNCTHEVLFCPCVHQTHLECLLHFLVS